MNDMNDKTVRTVYNGSWNNLATEKTAQQVVKAVEKVEKAAEKIVDTVKRTGTTNAEQTTAPASATSTVADGLTCIAESAIATAQHLRIHPDEGQKVVDSMEKINRQLTDLTFATSQANDNGNKIREVISESKSTADHILGNFNVPSSCGCYVGNGAFAALLRQRYGE